MNRQIFASREVGLVVSKAPGKKMEVYSFFPVDRASCECQEAIFKFKEELQHIHPQKHREYMGQKGSLTCPRSKEGMKRYGITCNNCHQLQGYCWATDATLKDWCDFHYVQWTDGIEWFGCLTPHVSPITEQLCLECTCGYDTRDFRANMTLNEKRAVRMEEENSIGREFNKQDSKFKVRTVSKNVLPFK